MFKKFGQHPFLSIIHMFIDNILVIDIVHFLNDIKYFQKPTYIKWILWWILWIMVFTTFGELSNVNECSSSCESSCGVVRSRISLGGFTFAGIVMVGWILAWSFPSSSLLQNMKYSYTSFETSSQSRTINKVIMFWSSMILIFLTIEVTMLAMASACSHKVDSLSFNCFCFSFANHAKAFRNLNHHRSLVVVVPKSQI